MRSGQFPTITKTLRGNALFDPSYVASSYGGAPVSMKRQYNSKRPLISLAPYIPGLKDRFFCAF